MNASQFVSLLLWHHLFVAFGAVMGSIGLCGCSDATPRRYSITGAVTLDGEPVQDATIVFTPKQPGLAAAASIVDGHFMLSEAEGPTQGEFNVRINPTQAELEEVNPAELAGANRRPKIPRNYQRDGMLTAEITGVPGQTLIFELVNKR